MSEDWEQIFSEPFELNEDPKLSSLGCHETEIDDQLLCFSCLGEVDPNKISVNENGYFRNAKCMLNIHFKVTDTDRYGTVHLFDRRWDKGGAIYKLDMFFKMLSKEIMLIEHGASAGISAFGNNLAWNNNCQKKFKESRLHCLEFLKFLHQTINVLCSNEKYYWMLKEIYPTVWKRLNCLKRQIGFIFDLPDYVHAHSANSLGNKSTQASYHLFHLHLDIKWHYLVLLHSLSHARSKLPDCDENISPSKIINDDFILSEIQSTVIELLELSLKRFEKLDLSSLIYKSPFCCTCVQELWMLLIMMTAVLGIQDKGKTFWDILNYYLDMRSLQVPHTSERSKLFQLNPTSFSVFSLWFLCIFARLHRHVIKDDSNSYPLLEANLKNLLSRDVSEANLRTIMILLEKLCLEVWEPKPETMLILWEHFHKKINSNFYIPGAPPSTLAFVCKTPKSLINQLKSYLEDQHNVNDSFQHFLRIIGLHLKKSQKVPRNWNLLKGRLYSKLTLSKLETLSHVGEYHFISLFLILAISQDIGQIEAKMVEIIGSYLNKQNYLSEELMKGQLGLALLLLENERDASAAIQPVSNYIQTLSITESMDRFRMYVETFRDISRLNVPLNLGQHLFIGNWISDYLSISSATDVSRLLDTLVSLLNRLKLCCDFEMPEQNIIIMIEKMWDQLKYYLERVCTLQETPYQVSEIAASLANISIQVRNKERFTEIVNMFAFRSVTDVSVLRQFVCAVSQNERINDFMPNFDKVVLKTWVKCCFLCSDMEHSEMTDLTKMVMKLPDITDIFGEVSFNLYYSSEPFLKFLENLQKTYVSQDIFKRASFRQKVSVYFDGLESWIRPFIVHPRDSGKILFLYKMTGNMIRLISPIIYPKGKPNTLLQQLIDLLLLSNTMKNPGTKIHPHILSAVKATFHLYIEGLSYLDPANDLYISRVLKELLLVHIPHCMNQNSSSMATFVLIHRFSDFDNSTKLLLLELISNVFLRKKARTPHTYATSALKLIKEIVITHKTNEDVLLALVNGILERICDVLMYCEDKLIISLTKEILHFVLNSELLRSSNTAGDCIMDVLRKLCLENLAWSSRLLFDLLVSLTSVAPDLVRRFSPTLLEQVKNVEAKRGVGYDRTLRLGIDRVENSLREIRNAS